MPRKINILSAFIKTKNDFMELTYHTEFSKTTKICKNLRETRGSIRKNFSFSFFVKEIYSIVTNV